MRYRKFIFTKINLIFVGANKFYVKGFGMPNCCVTDESVIDKRS